MKWKHVFKHNKTNWQFNYLLINIIYQPCLFLNLKQLRLVYKTRLAKTNSLSLGSLKV